MADFVSFMAWALGTGLVAIIIHELSHAVTAVLVGRRVHVIDLTALHVEWALPANGPDWRDRLIGAAPLLLAVSVGAGLLLGAVSVPAGAWVGVLVLGGYGGLEDLRVTRRHDLPDWWADVADRREV